VTRDGGFHRLPVVDHRDLHSMPDLRQGDERALAEAVVRGDKEQDA